MITATVIEHSIARGVELVTFELQYPRFIHSELMTHRVFSRNAMSSRAIPIQKMLDQVANNPAETMHWGAAQKGMQAAGEVNEHTIVAAKIAWRNAADSASKYAKELLDLGLHKQVANRLLEPFQWMRTILTATELDNFYALRIHPDAEPNIEHLARAMLAVHSESIPVERNLLIHGEISEPSWHLPYVSVKERSENPTRVLCQMSAARCARVSYLTHDNEYPSQENDIALFNKLANSRPAHASPLEHQALAVKTSPYHDSNFRKPWLQHRRMIGV